MAMISCVSKMMLFMAGIAALVPAAAPCGIQPTRGPAAAGWSEPEGDALLRARELLAHANRDAEPEAREAFLAMLGSDEGHRAALRAAAETANAPEWLLEPLEALARSGAETDSDRMSAVYRALGSVRSPRAVRALIDALAGKREGAARDAAAAALSRLTGRADLGASPSRWRDWYASVEWLPEPEWRRIIAEGVAARADELARGLDGALGRLVELKRSEYRLTASPEGRSALLAALLRDDIPTLRKLGVELVTRELANSRTPDEAVLDAAMTLLGDRSAELRASAARLVTTLAPSRPVEALFQALGKEEDPLTAEAMLRAASRWPSARLWPQILLWVESEPAGAAQGARLAALDAAASALAHGERLEGEDRERLVRAARASFASAGGDAEGAHPGTSEVLVRLGSADDRRAVAGLLASSAATSRSAAAEALAGHPDGRRLLLGAAESDPTLLDATARALTRNGPDADAFMRLSAIKGVDAVTKRDALVLVASALPTPQLLAVARRLDDATTREAVLERFVRVPLALPDASIRTGGARGPTRALPRASVAAGLMLLARTRLDLGQPAGALAALDLLLPVATLIDAATLDSLRTVALLWLDRIEEADLIAGSASAWVEGLERSAELAHGPRVLAWVRTRFGESLDQILAERIERVSRRLAAAPTVSPPSPASGYTPPK
ncbi:MAG: hypothetical protein JNM07_01710 [Phycisphaerae bacterium]|nr:hypothetical protein [Phycisphaerae bacterium]